MKMCNFQRRSVLTGLLWMGFMIIGMCQSANILGVFTFPGKSHSIMSEIVMTELARRGHNVTVITNFRLNEKLANYSEVLIEPAFDYWIACKCVLNISKFNSSYFCIISSNSHWIQSF